MRRHLCTQLLPRLRTRGYTPQLLAPHSSSILVRQAFRFQSSSAQAQARTAQDATRATTRPFAIERVGGRECHISWSEEDASSGVQKEWRDIAAGDPESGKIAVGTSNSWTGRISSWVGQMFLPTNYPQSVHRSYLPFHILQFVETTLATITSVLCNQALLTSVGVSAEGSIFGAVAVQWIIKDGAGEVAKLFFIRHFSPYFDSHPKTFTLFGEVIGCLGSGLQIATLLIVPSPGNFLLCAAGGNIFKLVGNAIWFTTHIKFMRYFSTQGNTGDVAAKDESQASIAQLFGYASGISLLTFSHTAAYLYSIFFLAVPLHLTMTAYMMRVATFELLTLPRISRLAEEYVMQGQVSSLEELDNSGRTGLFGEFYKDKADRWLVPTPRVSEVLQSGTEDERIQWQICAEVFKDDRYLLFPLLSSRRPGIAALYHPDASNDDMLRSILHATLVRDALLQRHLSSGDAPLGSKYFESIESRPSTALRTTLLETRAQTESKFTAFKSELEARGWRTDELCYADHGHRVTWTHDG
ncbi:DUF647-domain-containing protein [Pilatotrama ljubarskyi]|nr:DUF647-domain-containing protein [Pilatotrama ljubarskyi]